MIFWFQRQRIKRRGQYICVKNEDLTPGFTLIELLIALVLSVLIIGAVYATFNSQQKSFFLTNQKADMQQQGRAAVNMLMRDIRMAGCLVTPSKAIRVVNNNIVSATSPASDEVTVLYADPGFSGLTIVPPISGSPPTSIVVEVQSGGTFAPNSGSRSYRGKNIFLITSDESHSVIRNITRAAGSDSQRTFTLGNLDSDLSALSPPFDSSTDNSANYSGGSAYILKTRTYSITSETLYIKDHNGGSRRPLAEGAEILQCDFLMSDGSIQSDPVSGTYSIDQISAVRIYLLMKNNTKDPDYNDTTSYSLGISNVIYKPRLSTALSPYRRRLFTSLVRLRNFGL